MSTVHLLPVAYQIMIKPIGSVCNLECEYCYYLDKELLYTESPRQEMSLAMLESFTRQYIESQNVPVVSFVWHGGEATLRGIDFYRKAVQYQQLYRGNKTIENAFQTNGTLLNDEWCRFFKENNFLVGISIDGPRHCHNHYRVNKGGQPTFEAVMRGIELLKRHSVEFNTMSVVHDYNVRYPLEVYRFLKQIGSRYMQFSPIVERLPLESDAEFVPLLAPTDHTPSEMLPASVPPLAFGRFLTAIFDEWVLADVGRYFVPTFDATLANWMGVMPGTCIYSRTCGQAAALEHNGDLYACDHYVFPEYRRGNINKEGLIQMMYSPNQIKFGNDKHNTLPRQCLQCPHLRLCHGECPKNRIAITADGQQGLNYLCEGYRHYYKHVAPYMEYMAGQLRAERAPANVMEWARERRKR